MEEVSHGLFSYQLARGIAGMADADKNGVVDSDELYQYTLEWVLLTAKREFGRTQTPVRILGEDSVGRFSVAGLKYRNDRLATQNSRWLEQRPGKAKKTALSLVKYSDYCRLIEGLKGSGRSFNEAKQLMLEYLKEEHESYKKPPRGVSTRLTTDWIMLSGKRRNRRQAE